MRGHDIEIALSVAEALEELEDSSLKFSRKIVNGELLWHVKAGKHKHNFYAKTLLELYHKLIAGSVLTLLLSSVLLVT